MNGTQAFSAMIAMACALCGCGKASDSNTQKLNPHQSRYPRIQATAEALNGVWESDCNVEFADNGDYLKTRYFFNQGILFKQLDVFQDRECRQNPMWERSYGGQYRLVGDELQMQFFNLTVFPQHYTRATLLNLPQSAGPRFCRSEVPYEAGKAQSFSPVSLCNEESGQSARIDLRGDGGYGVELFIDHLKLTRTGPMSGE